MKEEQVQQLIYELRRIADTISMLTVNSSNALRVIDVGTKR